MFNDQIGPVSTQTIGIKTGATGLDEVGMVQFVNDMPYINRAEQLDNGRKGDLTTVYKSPSGSTRFTPAESITNTFNGMQVMPQSQYPSGGLTSFKVYD